MARANTQEALRAGDARTDLSKDAIKKAFIDNLFFVRAKFPEVATKNDLYVALAYTIRDRILRRWVETARTYLADQSRTVVYLSAEFLLGPHLGNNMISLRCLDAAREAVKELGYDLDDLLDQEEEPGLGNGGLGRLAACYLDSMAHLGLPAIGYGIRYEFGIFDQEIRDGWQIEITDKWLRYGNPWEIVNPEITHPVKLGGRTESYKDADGKYRVKWIPSRDLVGVAHDTPIAGYGVENTNFLRLWKAEATEHFDFQAFNIGDYYRAVNDKVVSENITKVLYPNDVPSVGKELRLQQQYFFVTCSLQDMIRIYKMREKDLRKLHEKFVVQLNDTHPAIGVAELMRLLVDEHGLGWEDAWECTRKTFAYTNHTLLPEALECWPVELFKRVLPRHWEIVLEINARFLAEVRKKFPNDDRLVQSLSIIDEHGERYVRMANLAAVGSRAINGVAALHTELLKADVMKDFNRIEPKKFNNKTNGVTPRRFLLLANPRLAALITSKIGDGWVGDLSQLKGLEKFADDAKFQEDWRAVKLAAKTDLAKLLQQRAGVTVDPKSVFDILVKRIHEYKRQHLDVLGVIHRYLRILRGEALDAPPRTFIFAGKAAPGYTMAKRIIKLVHCVASVVNNDPKVGGRLKVAFFPDFNVKNAQHIYPACDVSEQISTAGKEASGTGCMKFMINGALTIGTLDGANVEIREEVGDENFFLFGLTTDEVKKRKDQGYRPWEIYESDPRLKACIDMIKSGAFSKGDKELFKPLIDHLMGHDTYMLFADFASYIAMQDQVDKVYKDTKRWTKMSILNVARSGKFSSDRAIAEYAKDIWDVTPVPVKTV
ncbi:MAG: glycogen/starch/alpha-glucan phosphorylase [Planctomycetota bacterium]